MREKLGRWIGTAVCVLLLVLVATMDRRYRGAPEVKAEVTSAVGSVGERLPDFTLPDLEGRPVSLSQFYHTGRIILTFERSLDW